MTIPNVENPSTVITSRDIEVKSAEKRYCIGGNDVRGLKENRLNSENSKNNNLTESALLSLKNNNFATRITNRKLGFDCWSLIIDYIDDFSTLANMRLLDKQISAVVHQKLYESPKFKSTFAWAQYVLQVENQPKLGEKLIRLEFDMDIKDGDKSSDWGYNSAMIPNRCLEFLDGLLHLLNLPLNEGSTRDFDNLENHGDMEADNVQDIGATINHRQSLETLEQMMNFVEHSNHYTARLHQRDISQSNWTRIEVLMQEYARDLRTINNPDFGSQINTVLREMMELQSSTRKARKNKNQIVLYISSLVKLFKMAPNLRYLSLSNQALIDDEYIVETEEFLSMLGYNLDKSCYTLEHYGPEQLLTVIFTNCTRLQHLDLSFNDWVNTKTLKIVLENCRQLKSLNLQGCSRIGRFAGLFVGEQDLSYLHSML